MSIDIQEIQATVEKEAAFIDKLTSQISSVIVGQKYLVERLLVGILADGHILIEGVPGLAKTLSVKSLANCLNVKFSRLQFTPEFMQLFAGGPGRGGIPGSERGGGADGQNTGRRGRLAVRRVEAATLEDDAPCVMMQMPLMLLMVDEKVWEVYLATHKGLLMR